MYIKDAACRFIELNPAWSEFTGITPERALGKTAYEIYPSEYARVYDTQDRELMERGEGVSTLAVKVPRADGTVTEMILTKSVLRRADGSIRGIVGTATDVSELKRVEQVVRESEERMRFWLENIRSPSRSTIRSAAWSTSTRLSSPRSAGRWRRCRASACPSCLRTACRSSSRSSTTFVPWAATRSRRNA